MNGLSIELQLYEGLLLTRLYHLVFLDICFDSMIKLATKIFLQEKMGKKLKTVLDM